MHKSNLKYLAVLIASLAGSAHAAGFALIEQNASGLGNAYAGAAAVAQDASTIYFNPAGMTLLPDSQMVMALHAIKPKAEFSGTVTPALGGGQGGDAGDWALVPNFYYARRLTPQLHVGVGVNAPFGLKTEYDDGWIGRYQALKSEIKTININPSIAYKVSDTFSVGAGLNVQRVEATLTNAAGLSSVTKMQGDDYGWGFNLGAIWQPTPDTRIGLSYRSEVDYTLEGDQSLNGSILFNVTADLTVPDSASLSLFHKLSPKWDLLADITWTGWSDFYDYAVYDTGGTLRGYTLENWEDIMRYSLGLTWHMNDKLSLRGGVAYDEAPVSDVYRTPRIPDGARIWVTVGGQYRLSKQGVLDFGYAHLFVNDPGLDYPAPATALTPANRLTGTYDSAVDIISVQYTHNF